MPKTNPINWIVSTSCLERKSFCHLLIFSVVPVRCVQFENVLVIAKSITELSSLFTSIICLLLAINPRIDHLSRWKLTNYTGKLSSSNWELGSGSTSCSSFSWGTMLFMQCINSTCSSEEKKEVIHGKKSSKCITGILHMNCQTNEACSFEVNCCISRGKTCNSNVHWKS